MLWALLLPDRLLKLGEVLCLSLLWPGLFLLPLQLHEGDLVLGLDLQRCLSAWRVPTTARA